VLSLRLGLPPLHLAGRAQTQIRRGLDRLWRWPSRTPYQATKPDRLRDLAEARRRLRFLGGKVREKDGSGTKGQNSPTALLSQGLGGAVLTEGINGVSR
jgi:hypothetical protein